MRPLVTCMSRHAMHKLSNHSDWVYSRHRASDSTVGLPVSSTTTWTLLPKVLWDTSAIVGIGSDQYLTGSSQSARVVTPAGRETTLTHRADTAGRCAT